MAASIPLTFGKFYHIYNRGINGSKIFRCEQDYRYFLRLYGKYVELIGDTFAWCLLENHFHFLVRIKEENEIGYLAPVQNNSSRSSVHWKVISEAEISRLKLYPSGLVRPVPYRQFSHLFNAYTKYFNKKYKRTGSLFEKNFKKKKIESEQLLIDLVCYIHNNPVHHGLADQPLDYPWSSYHTSISSKPTKLKREMLIGWFDSVANFKYMHGLKREIDLAEDLKLE